MTTQDNKKIWTTNEIEYNIQYNYKWLVRAVLALYQLQTTEEQFRKTTISKNNKGFDVIDAQYMSSIAQQIQEKRFLSMRDQYRARRILRKYIGQLTKIANCK
jgi:hypothetical protein